MVPQQQQQQQQLTGNPSDGVVSRLSFDPSLPSYYRVSMTALCQHFNLIIFFYRLRTVVSNCLPSRALQHHFRRWTRNILGDQQESDFPVVLSRLSL